MTRNVPDHATRSILAVCWVALAFGIALRLLWPSDSHFLADQAYNYQRGVGMGRTEPWDWLGMQSSGGFRNPGMSAWVFVLLCRAFSVTHPAGLARAVTLLNCAALLLAAAWAAAQLRGADRAHWLAGVSLAAANPTAIWLQRTIWAQSTAPLFAVLFWIGFWNRRRWWGALLWGCAGPVLAQIHLAGFFLAGGVLLWVILFQRASCWWCYGFGSLLSGWPLLFWLKYMAAAEYVRPVWAFWQRMPGKAWLWWFLTDSGLGSKYVAANLWMLPFGDFLREPRMAGVPTYGVLAAHALLAALMLGVVWAWVRRFAGDGGKLRALLLGDGNTAFLLRAALLGFGGLISLMPAPVFVHYFLVAFPVGFIWMARLLWPQAGEARRRLPPAVLIAAVILQFSISLAGAAYVHRERGAPAGSFGLRIPAAQSGQPGTVLEER